MPRIPRWQTYNTKDIRDEYLFRYTKKSHVIDFLKSENLYMTQMNRFDDKLEGISTFDIQELMISYNNFFQDNFKDSGNYSEMYKQQCKTDAKPRLQNVLERLNQGQAKHYVSCWFNAQRESDGMWRFYGREDGFAIRVNRLEFQRKIQDSVNSNLSGAQRIIAGRVKYQDYLKGEQNIGGQTVLYLAFRKDTSFSHENEYRFVIVDDSTKLPNHQYYKLNSFSDLEVTIICHPGMPHENFLKAKEEFQKHGINITVKKSELEPFYQLQKRTKKLGL